MTRFAPALRGFLFLTLATAGAPLPGADVQTVATYKSSISQDAGGALDLKMELNYDDSNSGMPVMVVMHQFSASNGNFSNYRANAQRLRDQGFFVLTVAMRGREGSDGVRDSGGLEIYDIYDAVEHVKDAYGGLVDASNINITGYSGGGGNAMSALTKFPDYFTSGASFFGMSDYGYDSITGWYNNGAGSGHRSILNNDIGNPNTGGDTVLDAYMARASNLASMNNPYSEIHLFVNSNETTSPPVNDTLYKDNAVAAETHAGEFDNITVHIGDPTGATYEDFNSNGIKDPGEEQNWPHQAPTATQQAAAEQWYTDRVLSGAIAAPTLNSEDALFVAGFVKTTPFEFWLGDGQNAAGLLDYRLGDAEFEFTLGLVSLNTEITGTLTVELGEYDGISFDVFRNGTLTGTFTATGSYLYEGLADGDTLLLRAIPEPTSPVLIAGAVILLTMYRRRKAS